ncbi:hypothetical protein DPMN_040746 [Dreissena polymorpha]|uniref:Uncharacterized protein n=1 Tax=Dreissena polymorpha TaxID=45954 RepID=A0A9D4CXI1_DREPO|nr:hypothetical protein DPMN_040746 [Dreissena polymorpha]
MCLPTSADRIKASRSVARCDIGDDRSIFLLSACQSDMVTFVTGLTFQSLTW